MKKIILGAIFLFTISFAFAGNKAKDTFVKDDKIEIATISERANTNNVSEDTSVDYKLLSSNASIDSCTYSMKIYVVTDAGIVGVGFSITADTCEEARAGVLAAIRGFVEAM